MAVDETLFEETGLQVKITDNTIILLAACDNGPNFIAISIDSGEFVEVPKYEYMNTEQLCNDTEFYIRNQDFDAAQSCVECALRVDDKAINKNWEVYYYAGFIALKQKVYDASVNLIKHSMELGCPYLNSKCVV